MFKIEGDERQIQALAVLIDAAVKALGVRGAADAVYWIGQIESAMKAAQAKAPQPVADAA